MYVMIIFYVQFIFLAYLPCIFGVQSRWGIFFLFSPYQNISSNEAISVTFRIRHKLFATLLLTSVIVTGGLFFFLQWNFDRGFLNYVKGQELVLLERFAVQISAYYAKFGSWEFIAQNHPLWRKIQRETAPVLTEEGGGPGGNMAFTPPRPLPPPGMLPPGGPRDLGPRIILFDADKNWVIGGPREESLRRNLTLQPLTVDAKTIGYLGLIPFTELSYSGDLLFVEQQTTAFVLIATLMVGLSLLLTFPVTVHLLRPINALTEGTRKLIAGHFKTRIAATTGDELGRLSADFNILAETLEKNEKNRQLWVADISHELRTPLAVLRGEVEALQDGIRRPDSETIAALHGEILHLERMVNDLYELSMSDIGALNYKKVEVNPVGIVAGTVEFFDQRLSQKGLELKTDLDLESSCFILADPDRLQQLFSNVLENCLRYTSSPGTIRVMAKAGNDCIAIDFQDSAPGVTVAQLPRLFDRLYRVEESRNRATGGAGLGLAICKNIVDAHHGKITANSSPLGGIWIKIQLPLHG